MSGTAAKGKAATRVLTPSSTGRRKPPAAGRGRKLGELNKFTRAAREAFTLAFEGIGGVEALVTWAKRNRREFYKLYARLIPAEPVSLVATQINHFDMSRPIPAEQAAAAYEAMVAGTLDIGAATFAPPRPALEHVPVEMGALAPIAAPALSPGDDPALPPVVDDGTSIKTWLELGK